MEVGNQGPGHNTSLPPLGPGHNTSLPPSLPPLGPGHNTSLPPFPPGPGHNTSLPSPRTRSQHLPSPRTRSQHLPPPSGPGHNNSPPPWDQVTTPPSLPPGTMHRRVVRILLERILVSEWDALSDGLLWFL